MTRLPILNFTILLFIKSVAGTIYKLNATEYSRMPTLYDLDEYESCLRQHQAVYCVVKVDLSAEPGNLLMETIREYSNDRNRHFNYSHVDRGVCVRTRCARYISDRDLNNDTQLDDVLQQCLNDTFFTMYGLEARLALKLNCDRTGEREEITFLDKTFLLAVGTLLLVVILGTVYHIYLERHYQNYQGNQYILSFSIKRNWRSLLSSQADDFKTVGFHKIHGVRTIGNLLVVFTHVGMLYSSGFIRNTHDVEKLFSDRIFTYIIFCGLTFVQIFFYISGFLMAYQVMNESDTRKLNWKDMIIHIFKRFMRLTPCICLVVWFTSTWMRHLGSGPLWKPFVTNTLSAHCSQYWWSHLLFINNYVSENRFCCVPTWQVAVDTQLYIVGLALLIITFKGSRNHALVALLLLGTLLPALHTWLTGVNSVVLMTPQFFRDVDLEEFYLYHIRGHNNIQNYVFGMMGGIFVHKYHKKGKDFSKIKWYGWSEMVLMSIYVYLFYMGHVFYDEKKPSLVARLLYATMQRLILGLFNSYLIIGLVLNGPGFLGRIYKHQAWAVTSRLNFSVYLIHMKIIFFVIASRTHVCETSLFQLILLYFGILVFSYTLGTGMYLLVESPFIAITKVIITRSKSKPSNNKLQYKSTKDK